MGLPAAVVPSVLAAFPCEPNAAFGPAAPLLTECVNTGADFVNGYLFTCPMELAASMGVYQKPVNSYGVMFGGAMPGPSPYNTEGKDFLLPNLKSYDKPTRKLKTRLVTLRVHAGSLANTSIRSSRSPMPSLTLANC